MSFPPFSLQVNGVPVDCGFLVFNENTYPNMIGLFEELDVPTEPSDMSFAVSLNNRSFEWSSTGLKGLKGNATNGQFWSMMQDMLRFNKEAPAYLERCKAAAAVDPEDPLLSLTMGEFLAAGGYSAAFKNYYLLPQMAAVWSASSSEVLKFPAQTFITFSVNHSLLQILDRPQWRTVSKRSRSYVSRIAASLNPSTTTIKLNTAVTAVKRVADASSPSGFRVTITSVDAAGVEEQRTFDQVVFASHPDETLAMIGRDATAEEKRVLGQFVYQPNTSYLHTDEKLMPKNKDCWASWNYIGKGRAADKEEEPCCVSYWLNLLQNLPPSMPQLFITLNPSPDNLPDPSKVVRTFSFAHPQYTRDSVNAQAELQRTIQGANGCYYASASLAYGFHEDAITSGLRAAHRLSGGACRPSWWDKPLYTIPAVLKNEAKETELQELVLKRAAGGPYWQDNLGNGGAVGKVTAIIKELLIQRANKEKAGDINTTATPSLGVNSAGDVAGRIVCFPVDAIHAFKTLVAGTEEPSRSDDSRNSHRSGHSSDCGVSDKSGTETGSEEEEDRSMNGAHRRLVTAAADQITAERDLKSSPTSASSGTGSGGAGGLSIFSPYSASDLSLAMAASASAPAASSPTNGAARAKNTGKATPGSITLANAARRRRLIKAFAISLQQDRKAGEAGGEEEREYKEELALIEGTFGYRRAFKQESVRKLFWPSASSGHKKTQGLGQLMEKGLGGYTVQEEPLHRPDVHPSFFSYAWHTLKGAALSTAASPVMGFLDKAIKKGSILFRTPDGTEHIFGDPSALPPFRARLRVHSWRFFLRVAAEADIGLARSFIAGEWSTDDLTSLFRVFVANRDDSSLSAGGLWMSRLGQTVNYLTFALSMDNDPAGSRKNISAHYDLSNDLFSSFLDASSTMMYSCAFFETERRWVRETNVVGRLPNNAVKAVKEAGSLLGGSSPTSNTRADALDVLAMQVSAVPLPVPNPHGFSDREGQLRQELCFKGSLPEAQVNKLDQLIARANVQKSDRVLDLGFGWGGLSIRLAETVGCRVHGITLSKEQHDLALERVKARGLDHLITFEIVDYRAFAAAHKGEFDRILSCEMIEAVGHAHFGTFMKALDDLLAPNGVVVIQAITIPETRWKEYISSTDMINHFIFPGGCCVSLTALLDANAKAGSALTLQSTEDFSLHYAETLRRWRANFGLAFEDVVKPQGFDDAFARTWNYYLAYCEAGFQSQTLGLHVLTFARPGTTALWVGQSSGRFTPPYGPCINTPGNDAILIPADVL